jgi:AcrR family transcriptional regulator
MVTSDDGGRRQRDPAGARGRILEAAAQEFSQRGFAGARVDRIAAQARVNKRMLYHYFGDKHHLQQAVLEARLSDTGSPGDLVPRGLDALTARLLMWTLMEQASAGPGSSRLDSLQDGIVEAQRSGRLLPDLDPYRLAALLLWGQAVLEITADRACADTDAADANGAFLRELLQALGPRPRAATKPRVRLKQRRI